MNLENQTIQQHPDVSKPDGYEEFKRNQNVRDLRRNDLLRRAYVAYYSFAPEPQNGPYKMKSCETHPDSRYSFINKREDNREYVILANMKGPLAVYRVQKRDLLQRLESYDSAILEKDALALDFSLL